MRRGWGWLGIFLAGCGQAQVPDLRLELPAGDHRSAVLVFTGNTGVVVDGPTLWALDVADPDPALLPLPEEARYQVTALLFDVPLSELDLSPGAVTLDDGGAEVSRPLPAPDTLVTAQVLADGAGAWKPLDALPDDLAALRLPVPTRCRRTTGERLPGEAPGSVRWAIPYTPPGARAPDRVLVAMADDTMWMAQADGLVPLAWADVPALSMDAGFMGGRGRVQLTAGEGEVWQAEVDLERRVITAGAHGFAAAHFPGPRLTGPAGTEDELYILADEYSSELGAHNGFLVRYFLSGTPGGTLFYFPPGPSRNPVNPGDVAYVGPDEAVALWPYSTEKVVRFKDGGAAEETVPGVQQLEHVSGWGTVASTGSGRFFLHRGGVGPWREVAVWPEGVRLLSAGEAAAWGVDDADTLLQLVPGEGLCPDPPTVELEARAVVAIRGAVVVLGVAQNGVNTTMTQWFWLEP